MSKMILTSDTVTVPAWSSKESATSRHGQLKAPKAPEFQDSADAPGETGSLVHNSLKLGPEVIFIEW